MYIIFHHVCITLSTFVWLLYAYKIWQCLSVIKYKMYLYIHVQTVDFDINLIRAQYIYYTMINQ